MPVTGPDLRAERRAADVTATALSERLGVARQTVHGIEARAVLTIEQVTKYRKALADVIKASQAKVA